MGRTPYQAKCGIEGAMGQNNATEGVKRRVAHEMNHHTLKAK